MSRCLKVTKKTHSQDHTPSQKAGSKNKFCVCFFAVSKEMHFRNRPKEECSLIQSRLHPKKSAQKDSFGGNRREIGGGYQRKSGRIAQKRQAYLLELIGVQGNDINLRQGAPNFSQKVTDISQKGMDFIQQERDGFQPDSARFSAPR